MLILLLLSLTIATLSYINLANTLSFGLTGDDWMTLYRYILDFPTFLSHFSLSSYINDHSNYNFADLFMGIIYRVFSFNPFPYYLVSMIIRIITALSFYFAISSATKNKLTGYLSALLFSVMFAGIQTTSWVFNMNTYVSIIFFNIFIYFFTKFHKFTFFNTSILGTLLGLSFIITPNRMHGLLFSIPLIAFWGLRFLKQKLSRFIPLLAMLYLPILGFRFLIRSANDISYGSTLLNSITDIRIFKSILATFANAAIPEKVYEYFGISQNLKVIFIVFALIPTMAFLIKMRKSSPEISKFALLSLGIILSFIIMPLLIFDPNMIMNSDHRYLVIPGAFMMVVYTSLFTIIWKGKVGFLKGGAFLLIGIIFLLNIISMNNYFNYLSKEGALTKDSQKYFEYLKAEILRPPNDAPMVLLFLTDDPFYLYNAITFGFQYHMMLIDPRFGMDYQKSPFPADNMESLIDILDGPDSKELYRYGYNPVQIPLENVYTFNLQNKNLTNITPQVREYLKEKLPHLKQAKN